ncbi:MAG: ATP-dependent helicase UvrD/PcrA [Verrucomicrobiota bacterium]|jgi:DNA helicase II / ATP-dependent DNA helicase PcrA|nr:ATP-dependent helicase UvrD/PcrA [Verrucomicrobiota bacterium]
MRLFDLNPQQLEAVKATRGPVLILAGAGTGKTRVITARIAYLLSEGVSADKILAVTFTNKAANEMRKRVAAMRENTKGSKLTICTFHALCVRILRQDIDKLGYKSTFSIYDESDQLGLIRKIITRLAAASEKLDPNAARSFISKIKNQGRKILPSEQTLEAAVFRRYQEELKTFNAVDFDDLLILAVQLLNEFPDVRTRWQNRFDFMMVDEFQDTNRLQLDLVRQLGGSHRNVCVVGDDDQSIYGWRGAEISNILEFERDFPNPKIVKLEQNYRSTNAILGAANSIIRHNPRRRPKSLWCENGDGPPVRLVQVPDDREEANYVVGEIQKQQLAEQCPWAEFAVIFRMNAQSRLIEENLRRLHIPYRVVGGRSFFERREVKDLLAYLSCLVNPQDDVSLLRIVNTPARGIGASTIELAIQESNKTNQSVFETLVSEPFQHLLSQRTREAIRKFTELIDAFETKMSEPLTNFSKVVEELLLQIDYFQDLRRGCKTPEESLNREENVRELIRAIAEYQSRSTEGLPGFLAETALDRERQEEPEKSADGVTLITFHAAKGLEFSQVFLLGLEEGLLPHSRSKLEGNLDEERRLFYVGITRAKRGLTVTHCTNRLKYGSPAPCHPSSFLKDLDSRFTEVLNFHELTNKPAGEGTAKLHFAKMRELLGGS